MNSRSWSPRFAVVAFGGFALACGGDVEAVPIDDVAPDKLLVDLSEAEDRGLCQWASRVAREKVDQWMPSCGGTRITMTGCMRVPPECPATVAEWRACIPVLLDRLFEDPCRVLSFISLEEFRTFIDETPGCEGLGPCGTVNMMQ